MSKHVITIEGQKYTVDIDFSIPGIVELPTGARILIGKFYGNECWFPNINHHDGGGQVCHMSKNLGEWLQCSLTGELYRDPEVSVVPGKTRDYMVNHHVCQSVAFWRMLQAKHTGDPYWFIINGVSYGCSASAVCVNRQPRGGSNHRGFGGRVFRVKKLCSDEMLVIDDMWHQGTVPDWLRPELPDNAFFVQETKQIQKALADLV